MTAPRWVTAFLDLPTNVHDAGSRFWSTATGYAVSPARGDDGEFTTLLPGHGDPFLKVQRVRDGEPMLHLDLHVSAPSLATARAEASGASVVHRSKHGYVVLRSPGGLTFCFVTEQHGQRPGPTRWSRGHTSLIDQVSIDIPAEGYERECGFWAAVTGWERRGSRRHPELAHLTRPGGVPLRLLLQRLASTDHEKVTAHLDVATDDRAVETMRHVGLGAVVERAYDDWTVLRDPAGLRYCLTDRDPAASFD